MEVKIYVKKLRGETLEFVFNRTLDRVRVEHLKEEISKKEGTPVDQIRLEFDEKPLEDGKALSEYGITHESTVLLHIRLQGAGVGIDPRMGDRNNLNGSLERLINFRCHIS